MISTNYNWFVHRTNKFGNCCYGVDVTNETEHSNMTTTTEPNITNPSEFWTILNPPIELVDFYLQNGCAYRAYNNDQYILSKKASEVLSESVETFGCACVLYQIDQTTGKKIFILTIDNKPYLQNPQGGRNKDESSSDCIQREILEELQIKINQSNKLDLIGRWKFSNYNALVDTTFFGTTDLYSIQIDQDQISHLINSDSIDTIRTNGIMTISSDFIDVKLDETKYVVFVHEDFLDDCPEKIILDREYSFNGHHREAILRTIGKTKYNTSYLAEFVIF